MHPETPSEHTEITAKAFGLKLLLPHTNTLPRWLCNEFTCCCARSWTPGSGRWCLKMSCSGDVGLAIGTEGWWDEKKWRAKRQKRCMEGHLGRISHTKTHCHASPRCRLRHQRDGDTSKDRKYHWHTQHHTALAHSSLIIAYWAARPDALGSRASVTDGKGCQASPKKRVLKLIRAPSNAGRKILTRNGEIQVTWWQLHWMLGLISIFIMASTVSECLIRAITGICWVKVAAVTLGKCRAAAILTLLWCYFEEGLRRFARAFSSQSSY